MRRILMTLIVVAALLAGCGGDDDDGGPDNGAADEETEAPADDRSSSDGAADDLTGADGQALPEFEGGDEDLAGFPIPSPAGALEATVTEIDGTQAAQIVYTADRYDDVVDAYEGWFLDNGLIATAADRSLGTVVLGGADDSGEYGAVIITDGDVLLVQLTAP